MYALANKDLHSNYVETNIIIWFHFAGASCPTQVTKHLYKQYGSLSGAEECFQIDYISRNIDSMFVNQDFQGSLTPQTISVTNEPLSA